MFARQSSQILIYGKHPFFSVIKFKKRKIYNLYVSDKNKEDFFTKVVNENILYDKKLLKFTSSTELDKIFPYTEKNHQGYLAFVGFKEKMTIDDFISNIKSDRSSKDLPKLLILDSILDPHNLGAIIRTAVAFGIYHIITTSNNSAKDNATVSKTSVGLNEIVDLIEITNLNRTLNDLKNAGYFILGLAGEAAKTINEIQDSKNIALVLGNEGKGIRQLVKKNCDELLRINMKENVESLNVSVASAIAIYEIWGK